MQRSLKEIIGYSIRAVDGDIGKVKDFFFDDYAWSVRYLVAGTGNWLPGRKVLLSPAGLKSVDWVGSVVHVNRTKQEIEDSPPVDEDRPVSRQQEEELSQYFAWPVYWAPAMPEMGLGMGGAVPPAHIESSEKETESDDGDPHLRSVKEVCGYRVQAIDREIGHIEDFIVDDDRWKIRYLVADTVNWLPGKKVILAPGWITGISWDTRRVRFDLRRETIKKAPAYDPSKPVNREYETILYDYYGRPCYWESSKQSAPTS